ncbi:MAG: hypothetical protein ACKV2Q_16810 [Planctomycetaceae bacterium]
MPRTKNEPLPSVQNLPLLPSDLEAPTTVSPPTAEDAFTPTEMANPATEPLCEALAAPEPSLIDRLKASAAAEQLAAEAEWNTLVQKVATDSASEKEVADVLRSTGRSLADLEAATDRRRKINRLEALIADLPDAIAAQKVAQTAFNETKERHKKQSEEMVREFKAARGQLSTALRRREIAKTAEADLWRMSHEFPPAPPQWNNPYEPPPCIAAQLKVEEQVNTEIRAKLGPGAITGPTVPSVTPNAGFRVFNRT